MLRTLPNARFSLGRTVMTVGAQTALERAGESPFVYLARHARGDWGLVDAEDAQENEYSLAHGLRLMSVYGIKDGTRIWVITEHDRSATTILLPEEY